MEIQAGARCQLIRLWRRISPLLMFDVSPADSQAPLPHHPFILIHCTNNTGQQARVSADMEDFSSMYVWHLAGRGAGPVPGIQRSKLGAAWLRQAKPDLSRAFCPAPIYTPPVLTIRFPHTIFQTSSWKTLEFLEHVTFGPQRPGCDHFLGESIRIV